MNDNQLKKLEKVLTLIDGDTPTNDEIVAIIQAVLGVIESHAEGLGTDFKKLEKCVEDYKKEDKEVARKAYDNFVSELPRLKKELCDELEKKIKHGKDGKSGRDGVDADPEKIFNRVMQMLPKPQTFTPDSGETIIDKINEADEDSKIDWKKIKNAPKPSNGTPVFGGRTKIAVRDETTLKTKDAREFKFTGDGVTATESNGVVTVNVPGGASGSGDVVGPASSTDNAIARFNLATGKLLQDSPVTVGDTGNMAGVGTLNTHTIPGGTGTLALTTDIPTALGVFADIQFVAPSSAFTLTNTTNVQNLFDPAMDTMTLAANTAYFIDAFFYVDTGTTSHIVSLAFDAGSAVFSSFMYESCISVSNTGAGFIGTTTSTKINLSTAVSALHAATTNTRHSIRITGVMRVTTGGTFIPQIKFSADPTGTLTTGVGSYVKVVKMGADTVQATTNWA